MYFSDELSEMTNDELIDLLFAYESYIQNDLPWSQEKPPMSIEEFAESNEEEPENDDD